MIYKGDKYEFHAGLLIINIIKTRWDVQQLSQSLHY